LPTEIHILAENKLFLIGQKFAAFASSRSGAKVSGQWLAASASSERNSNY